jgi:hypothetical protein
MEKRAIDRNQAVPANYQSPEITEPGKGALDFPPPAISPQLSAILQPGLGAIAAMGTNQVNLKRLQSLPKRITVVSLVSDQPLHAFSGSSASPARNFHLFKGGLNQFDFRRRGRSKCASQRNTLAVDHHHPLRTFTSLGFADAQPPFFAEAKLPSAKVSSQSRYCRSSSSAKSARQISSQTPRSSHSLNRRQHVAELGYRSGRSRQRAPLLSTQRIPSSTLRLSRQGLPPFLPGAVLGSRGSSFSHCSSFKNDVVRAIGSPPIAYYLKSLKKSSDLTY